MYKLYHKFRIISNVTINKITYLEIKFTLCLTNYFFDCTIKSFDSTVSMSVGVFVRKFSRKRIAILLACVFISGNKISAMNTGIAKKAIPYNESFEDKTTNFSSETKIQASPRNLPKNLKPLYYTLVALGIPIAVILVILGIKFFGKNSGDQEQNTKGKVYYGIGKFKSIEDLKDAWEKSFGNWNGEASSFVDYLEEIDKKYTEEFKKEVNDKVTTELIKSGDSGAKIYFNGDNFDCYNNLDKKLDLTYYEREIISGIVKLFKDRLGIRPCSVRRFPHSFYFDFWANESICTGVATVCKEMDSWYCDLGLRN